MIHEKQNVCVLVCLVFVVALLSEMPLSTAQNGISSTSCTLIVNVNPHGLISVNGTRSNVTAWIWGEFEGYRSSNFSIGDTAILESYTLAWPNQIQTQYAFTSWSGDINSSSPTITITIKENTTITANFVEAYYVNFLTNNGGPESKIDPSGKQLITSGSKVPIKATPAAGYEFSYWTKTSTYGDTLIEIEDNTSASTTAWIIGFGTVTANFKPKTTPSSTPTPEPTTTPTPTPTTPTASPTPSPSPTPTSTATPSPTPQLTDPTPIASPTEILQPTPTETPAPTPTETATPTPAPTAILPAETPKPSLIASQSDNSAATSTPEPSTLTVDEMSLAILITTIAMLTMITLIVRKRRQGQKVL